jgi:glycosyltransferase involved in cell wall biosynthesis
MSSAKPFVSVIMIFLNGEKFFQEAIESVFAQTYAGWELVLVDDGSTDGSTRIALRYAQLHPEKVRYFEHSAHQNLGMSASRNLGIRQSQGDYIAFLDADDVYLPQKLEHQLAILAAQPAAAMVYGATQHWYSWTGKAEDLHRDRLRNIGVPADTLVQPPALIPLFLRRVAQTPGTCGVLVRREAIERVGGFEEVFRGMFEDQVFFFKLCLSNPVFVASGCWDRYRQHPESCAEVTRRSGHDYKRRPTPMYGAFLTWLEKYLIAREITNRELWNELHKELRPYRHPVWQRVSLMLNIHRARQVAQRLIHGWIARETT